MAEDYSSDDCSDDWRMPWNGNSAVPFNSESQNVQQPCDFSGNALHCKVLEQLGSFLSLLCMYCNYLIIEDTDAIFIYYFLLDLNI